MQTWTADEEARLAPYVTRRCHPWAIDELRGVLPSRHRAEIRRRRRALRRRLRRECGLAARPGRLAA